MKPSAMSEEPILVLVADDKEPVRRGLRAMLATCPDLRIIGDATNGDEAVRMAQSGNPDVVIMDVRMPVMDGIEATRRIKENRPETSILVLTLYASSRSAAEASGADAFLRKGCAPEDLFRAIRVLGRGGEKRRRAGRRGANAVSRKPGCNENRQSKGERKMKTKESKSGAHLKETMATFGKEPPGPMAVFDQLHKAAAGNGALSAKTKELIVLGISVHAKLRDAINYHISEALRAGASREEILESVGDALLVSDRRTMPYGMEAESTLNELEPDTSH